MADHETLLAEMNASVQDNPQQDIETPANIETPASTEPNETVPQNNTADEARLLELIETDIMGLTEQEHEAWAKELNELSAKVNLEETSETSTKEANAEDKTKDEEKDDTIPAEEAINIVKTLIGTPIKMAGTEVTFNSVEEIIRGLQQSADYVRKTTEIKPYRVALKRMQDVGLLENEEDFSLMLQAYQGDKDAISQLANLHGVEELTPEEELKNFVPNKSNVTTQTIALDDVISSLKSTGKLDNIQPIISNKFDDASTELVQATPQILSLLAEDVESGLYAQVESAMTKQKLLGLYNEQSSYLDNYMNTVIDLKKQQTVTTQQQQQQQTNKNLGSKVSGTPTPNTQTPPKKEVAPKVVQSLIDAMAQMSDEEYLKTFGAGS